MYTICIFLFYFTSNLMYWLFGFKYWVISIEVPHLIEAQKEGSDGQPRKRICTEKRYEVVNWIGILVNFIACAWLAWKRGVVSYVSAFVYPDAELMGIVLNLYYAVTILLFISALFLGDALRRLNKSFQKDNKLVVNKKTMYLHAILLVFHTFFILVMQVITVYAFSNPT